MPWLPLIAAGVSAAGGIAGNAIAAGSRDKATQLQLDALKNIQNVNTPSLEEMKIALQQYIQQGQMTPEMEQIIAQDPSLMAAVSTDPRLKDAQMKSLLQTQDVAAGGLRPEDIAALSSIRRGAEQSANSANEAVLQNMAQRGVLGSGDELAARLINNQQAANRENSAGLDVGATASRNALQAIRDAAAMASGMQSQEFSQGAQKASAQDAINRFNAMNAQNVQGVNVGARNQAQSANLAAKQTLANANVDTANKTQLYNKGLPQQIFQNNLNKAQVGANAASGAASAVNAQADRSANMAAGIGQGIGGALTSYGDYANKQEAADKQEAKDKRQEELTREIYGLNPRK